MSLGVSAGDQQMQGITGENTFRAMKLVARSAAQLQ